MDYICLKPCTMGGVKYISGDIIPKTAVLPNRTNDLIKMGLIAACNNEYATMTATIETTAERMEKHMFVTLLGKKDEPDISVGITTDDIAAVILALQYDAEEAAEFVRENIDDSDALMVLERLDSRKTVKKVIAEKTAGEI